MKVSIIGTGTVGSAFAFRLFTSGIASEIALINRSQSKALGDMADLTNALAGASKTKIYSGDYRACKNSDIVVITAGPAMKPGQTRLDLIKSNYSILKSIVSSVMEYNSDCILLLVSNPVDILTQLAIKFSGLPAGKVIGAGTLLDSMRLRSSLSIHYNVDPTDVYTFVVGEHGDSMVPIWSLAAIGGIPLTAFPEYDKEEMDDLFMMARKSAHYIKQKKGATEFGVAVAVQTIVEAIYYDKRQILPVSSLIDGYYGLKNICISVPVIVGNNGVERCFEIPISSSEKAALQDSARILEGYLENLDNESQS